MRINTAVKSNLITHEGAPAKTINAEAQLRRSVMACMLWENSFYEDGVSIADRITSLVPTVKPEIAYSIALEARGKMKLRHAPLLIAREMARIDTHKGYVGTLLPQIIKRADELAEFLAIYWKDGKQPISKQVKIGLAQAFHNFDEYQFAKWNRDNQVKLRDVMFLVHPNPGQRAELFKKIADKELETPDTWEVALSAGKDKKESWTRLLQENRLGALALLRNLRNMSAAKVDEKMIFSALENIKTERILPFRFITAARYAPQWEDHIEKAMLKCLEGKNKLPGKTILLVDVSGSMDSAISAKSDLMRYDAANGLAILARELCEQVAVFSFSEKLIQIPPRRGFALRDAITNSQTHWGTQLGAAVQEINQIEYDRIIVLTDEQSSDRVPDPNGIGYVINVAAYQNGVGYGKWRHIDGWSESVLDYIYACENKEQ